MPDPTDEIHITFGQDGYVIKHIWGETWVDGGLHFKVDTYVAKSTVELCDRVNSIAYAVVKREFVKRHSEAAPTTAGPKVVWDPELKGVSDAPAPGTEESPKTP